MRTYGDRCGIAHALDLVGDRWALLVVRELLLGPKRFTDLRVGLPNASSNLLSQRLRELEDTGVIDRRRLPPPANAWVYDLTEWGRELEPVVLALGSWGVRSRLLDPAGSISQDSLMLTFRTFFSPNASPRRQWHARYLVCLDDARWGIEVDGDRITVTPGDIAAPDTTVITTPAALIDLLGDRAALAPAIARGDVHVAGNRIAFERLLAAMVFPAKAPLAS